MRRKSLIVWLPCLLDDEAKVSHVWLELEIGHFPSGSDDKFRKQNVNGAPSRASLFHFSLGSCYKISLS